MIDSQIDVSSLVHSKNKREAFIGRQLLFASTPMSRLVETYLSTNEGRLQSLNGFPMKRAIYDNLPKKLLLKCSRKTLKSTLLSNIMALNAVRYNRYAQLYVAPQESSTKYFSGSYLSVRLESPNLKRVTSGFIKNDVFEKVIAGSNSTVLLRYASDDATRVRGPAVDELLLDECVSSTTAITLYDNSSKCILDLKPGEAILAFDEHRNIKPDRIKHIVPKGKRHTWRITLSCGRLLECTSNEKILTNRGWLYLAQLLTPEDVARDPRAKSAVDTHGFAETNGAWNNAWRHVTDHSHEESQIPMQPQQQADSLCATSGKDAAGFHTDTTLPISERRIWDRAVPLHDTKCSGIRILTQDVLGLEQPEACDAGMAGRSDVGRSGLLVYGRWESRNEQCDVSHRELHQGGSRTNGGMVHSKEHTGSRSTCGEQARRNSDILPPNPVSQGNTCDAGQHPPILHSINGLQMDTGEEVLQTLQRSAAGSKRAILQEARMPTRPIVCSKTALAGAKQEHGGLQGVTHIVPQETECETQRQSRAPGERAPTCKGTICGEEPPTQGASRLEEGTNIVSITYIGEQDVYDIETETHHTFFANGFAVHNCQDMDSDIFPILWYTMGMSDFQRERYSGTPLTTDNTIERLWKQSTQYEWGMRCGCGHWNFLRLDNDPMMMIQRAGLCCTKCGKVLDSNKGEWIQFNSGPDIETAGYHLAQPILPYFSNNPNRWKEIYTNVHLKDYGIAEIHNEIFGLSYDTGSKPITEEQLRGLCTLGPMLLPQPEGGKHPLHKRLALVTKGKYIRFVCGVDWGVNMLTSRTTVCIIGIRDERNFDVVYCEIIKNHDYVAAIDKIAGLVNGLNGLCASDAGPDPIRGLMLMEKTSAQRAQLATYRTSDVIQKTVNPGTDYRQARWVLHRSDTFSIMFNILKKNKINLNFPRWEDSCECHQDILNVFVETKSGPYRDELRYHHKPDCPDDFAHALNFALMQALLLTSNSVLEGQSSSGANGSAGDS